MSVSAACLASVGIGAAGYAMAQSTPTRVAAHDTVGRVVYVSNDGQLMTFHPFKGEAVPGVAGSTMQGYDLASVQWQDMSNVWHSDGPPTCLRAGMTIRVGLVHTTADTAGDPGSSLVAWLRCKP